MISYHIIVRIVSLELWSEDGSEVRHAGAPLRSAGTRVDHDTASVPSEGADGVCMIDELSLLSGRTGCRFNSHSIVPS